MFRIKTLIFAVLVSLVSSIASADLQADADAEKLLMIAEKDAASEQKDTALFTKVAAHDIYDFWKLTNGTSATIEAKLQLGDLEYNAGVGRYNEALVLESQGNAAYNTGVMLKNQGNTSGANAKFGEALVKYIAAGLKYAASNVNFEAAVEAYEEALALMD